MTEPKRKLRKKQRKRSHVALFVTCLADLFRPSVAFSSLRLLKQAGYRVTVPQAQTCCGQPAYNSGDYEAAIPVAQSVIATFEHAQYVVVPSGSCAGMLVQHYPKLLRGEWHQRAVELAGKTWELTSFLTAVAYRNRPLPAAPTSPLAERQVAYHDSCAGLRELAIREQPRHLLRELAGITALELRERDVCCGFGGTFCAKMPQLSAKMATDKLNDTLASGADTLLGGDLGCLLSLAGRASREGIELEFRHVAEVLAGYTDLPPIGGGDKDRAGTS